MLPSFDDPYLAIAIERLNLPNTPLVISIIPEPGALNGFCSENVRAKVAVDGGELIHGWQFYHKSYWLEAEFHAIWKSPTGDLIDITPCEVDLDKNLFVPDPNRIFDGSYRDNVRINTTNNPLVDGLILVEETIFKLQDQFYDGSGMRLMQIPEKTIRKGQILEEISYILTIMVARNERESDHCFCGSQTPYNRCCEAGLQSHLDKLMAG